jgi:hypothetical protein
MYPRMLRQFLAYFSLAAAWSQLLPAQEPSGSSPSSIAASSDQKLLNRHYQEGEKLSYHMNATNQDRHSTLRYEIKADGIVKEERGRAIH